MRLRLLSLFAAIALLVGVVAVSIPAQHATANANDGLYNATLLSSGARTATGTGDTACGFGKFTKIAVQQTVSAASGTTPTLDTILQHSIDGGTTWFTLVSMTQRTSAANELKVYADVEGTTAQLIGDCLRVSYTIGGTTPSFTFAVVVQAQ
jgi:hypothetical protein